MSDYVDNIAAGVTREYFTFLTSFYDNIELLNEAEQLEMFHLICRFALRNYEPSSEEIKRTHSPLFWMAWVNIAPKIKDSWRRYKNGLKGGAPKGNRNAAKRQKNNLNST